MGASLSVDLPASQQEIALTPSLCTQKSRLAMSLICPAALRQLHSSQSTLDNFHRLQSGWSRSSSQVTLTKGIGN